MVTPLGLPPKSKKIRKRISKNDRSTTGGRGLKIIHLNSEQFFMSKFLLSQLGYGGRGVNENVPMSPSEQFFFEGIPNKKYICIYLML